MKTKQFLYLLLVIILIPESLFTQSQAVIIDHSCCKIENIPESWIYKAKSQYRIAYGHTSHGSQIVTGMSLLSSSGNSIYTFNKGTGSLYLNDASILPGDLGNPDRTTWESRTRSVLSNNTQNINLIMWSWCGQVDGTQNDINTYLSLMNQLEQDFPDVRFIYMTGHLNGTGVSGNVNQRNEQIRKFCRDNNKILFDFADIESYDPDGKYFLDKGADDGCNYKDGNWADEWCNLNPGKCNTSCSCAHSECLNCQQKGKAFWWMMARIAGWDGIMSDAATESETDNYKIEIFPNPASELIEIKMNDYYQDVVVSITDIFGKNVYKYSNNLITNKSLSINIGNLSYGLYYCTVSTRQLTISKRILMIK